MTLIARSKKWGAYLRSLEQRTEYLSKLGEPPQFFWQDDTMDDGSFLRSRCTACGTERWPGDDMPPCEICKWPGTLKAEPSNRAAVRALLGVLVVTVVLYTIAGYVRIYL